MIVAEHPYRDVQILLVVFESFVIVTLAVVNIPDIIVRLGHVQVLVAKLIDLDLQALFVLL